MHLAHTNASNVANSQGGAHSSNVVVRPYPNVLTSVGKYALNDNERFMNVISRVKYHTLPSRSASASPASCPVFVEFLGPCESASSAIRLRATARSSGVIHPEEFSGKSGRTKMEMIATKTKILLWVV